MIDEQFNYLECDCWSPDHTCRISKMPNTKEVYLEIHLTEYPWYERIWVAVKYVFLGTKKYGHWEEIILNKENQTKLKKLLDD